MLDSCCSSFAHLYIKSKIIRESTAKTYGYVHVCSSHENKQHPPNIIIAISRPYTTMAMQQDVRCNPALCNHACESSYTVCVNGSEPGLPFFFTVSACEPINDVQSVMPVDSRCFCGINGEDVLASYEVNKYAVMDETERSTWLPNSAHQK